MLHLTNTRICILLQLPNKLLSSFFYSICSHVQMDENVQDHSRALKRQKNDFDYWLQKEIIQTVVYFSLPSAPKLMAVWF